MEMLARFVKARASGSAFVAEHSYAGAACAKASMFSACV